MRLGEWLDREDLKPQQFAARIGRSAEAVRRYVTGDRIPDKETMPLIVVETGGSVMPNDFFALGALAALSTHPDSPTDTAQAASTLEQAR